MLCLRPRRPALVIALAAIVGALSLGQDASASSAKIQAPRSCCGPRKMAAPCGCCVTNPPAVASATSGARTSFSASPGERPGGRLASSCECRLDEAPAPGSQPVPNAKTHRDDQTEVDDDPLTVIAIVLPVETTEGRLARRIGVPLRTPLYLRVSRLLI